MPAFFKENKWHCKTISLPEEGFSAALALFIENEFMTIDYPAFLEEFSGDQKDNYFH